ncbi:MAG: aminotransferase class III-fold pyridoxal phosphate-dependent enzyme [Candidatus Omnitrophica bacterium]|nr:aminotransferase class III-fold pyridoxal phosphate-dependent enzyme [Candidatus Omnitrophota bacterium]
MSGWNFNMKPVRVPKINTKYRKIITKLPVPDSLPLFKELGQHESRSMHGQMPVIWDRAEGFQVYDGYGNCWIDFTSTIFVANAGHSNPAIIRALDKAIKQKLLHTYTFAHKSRVEFIKKLIDISPRQFEKAFLLSAGTEATECAVKLMRLNGQRQRANKVGIVSFLGSMHGRTMGAEMLKGNPISSAWIGYLDPHIYHLPFPYPWDEQLRQLPLGYDWQKRFESDIQGLKDKGIDFSTLAGFMIESYLGWGAIFYPKAYLQALAKFAKKYNILITFDEIQGGFGRTGKLFVYQHYGVEPDLLCLGKAISGSLPLSAVIGPKWIMDLPEVGSMSSTHSANPLSCAAGLANIKYLKKYNLVKESERKGKILHQYLNKLKSRFPDRISYIFGKGLLAAVIFKDPGSNKPDSVFPSYVCERAMQKGLLMVHTGRESIKIGPPLTIPDKALIEGLAVLAEAINEVDQEEKQ